MATINSLGVGSGILTADILDQLREADDSRILKPLENKIELGVQKEDAYSLLNSLMTTFQSSTSALDGDNLYLSRAVTGNTDAVTVKADAGSNVQEFSITNVSKAESDVWNSASLDAKSTAITNLGSGTFSIEVNGKTFDIDYTADSSLNNIKDAINEIASDTMTASVLEVGPGSYELVITAKGTNEAITFTDSNTAVKQLDTTTLTGNAVTGDTYKWSDGTNELTINLVDGETPTQTGIRIADAINADPTLSALYAAVATADGFTIESNTAGVAFSGTSTSTGTQTSSEVTTDESINSLSSALKLNNIQVAKSATFDYNGIEITRDTNEITDLIVGVTITLNENQDITDNTSIKISQNSTSISSEMSLFVNGYNSLMTNLDDMTNSDRETGAVGIFNNESFVKSIGKELTKLITSVNSNGNSLIDYGIDIDRYGVMSLDNDVFAKKFVTDPEGMELFFSGNSETDGIFTQLDNKMTEYTGYKKLLSNFSDQLKYNQTSVTEQYDKQKASLDSRYEILTQRFIAYDAIISRTNAEFSAMESLIKAQFVDN